MSSNNVGNTSNKASAPARERVYGNGRGNER